jgi:hypothetical protein
MRCRRCRCGRRRLGGEFDCSIGFLCGLIHGGLGGDERRRLPAGWPQLMWLRARRFRVGRRRGGRFLQQRYSHARVARMLYRRGSLAADMERNKDGGGNGESRTLCEELRRSAVQAFLLLLCDYRCGGDVAVLHCIENVDKLLQLRIPVAGDDDGDFRLSFQRAQLLRKLL